MCDASSGPGDLPPPVSAAAGGGGAWICHLCTVENAPGAGRCIVCDAVRPGGGGVPGGGGGRSPQQQQQQQPNRLPIADPVRDELVAVRIVEQKAVADELEMIKAALDASLNVSSGAVAPGEVKSNVTFVKGGGGGVPMVELKAVDLHKNSTVTGTLSDDSFQMPIGEIEDPLLIKLFPGLACHALPQLGIYGIDYTPFDTMALIKMPSSAEILHRALPGDVWASMIAKVPIETAEIDYVVMVHDFFVPEEKSSQGPVQINVMTHPWVFAHAALEFDVQIDEKVDVGLFHPFNVIPGAGMEKDESSGPNMGGPVRFGNLGTRSAVIHNGAFSPNNVQFSLTHPSLASFYVVCRHENRLAITFHVLPGTESNRRLLKDVFTNSSSLQDVLQGIFDQPQLQMLYMQFRNLVFGFIQFDPLKPRI
jgi:hypothetical protein